MKINLTDLLDLLGFALVSAGVGMKFGPAESMMVSGALLLSISVMKALKGNK